MFHGIQPRRYRDVLDCLHASVHQYPRNTHLVELGEQSHNTGILLDGTVEEFLYDENESGQHLPAGKRADFWGRTGLYRLEYQSGLPAGRLRLYGAPVGFQCAHVPADHDLPLSDAGDR